MEKIVRRLVKSRRSGDASADALFIEEGKPLGEEGDLSGIFKECVRTIDAGVQGVAGDERADRRYHGGPDRALHQYPVEHYARLADAFPALREAFVPGCLGETCPRPACASRMSSWGMWCGWGPVFCRSRSRARSAGGSLTASG